MKVSVKKISEMTGFSPATVSNALNNKSGVNPETARIIRETAQQLGYYTENAISRIVFVMYKRDGSIIDDTPYFPLLVRGVEQECRENKLDMSICYLDRRSPDFDKQLGNIAEDKGVAMILLGNEFSEEDLSFIQGINCPFVVIDYWSDKLNFNSVLSANEDSAKMAVDYLYDKGHRKIGYIRGAFRIKPFQLRHQGYAIGMLFHGLKPAYTVTIGTTMETAYRDMKEYLDTNPDLPTAYFADNDMIALGAMKALTEKGFRIPDDISIIGYDDISYSTISSPPLTTIRVTKEELGRVAVRRLVEVMNGKDTPTKIITCNNFIERESVKQL